MKVLGTEVAVRGSLLHKLREKGYNGHNGQFRIICGCKSMADANRQCNAIGLGNKVFVSGYCDETGNKQEISLAGNGGVFIALDFSAKSEYIDLNDLHHNFNNINKGME